MVVKVKSGKERQVVRINYDGKSDGCEVKERNNARQPNRDKFQELDATGSGQEEKRDSSSSYDTLQIYGPCWKVHWGTRETQPLPSSPQQVGSASQQFTAYRLFLSIGPRCSTVRQARRSPRGTFQFQNIDIQPSFVSQWKCQCPCRSETAVESPDQSPRASFNHLWRLRWAPHTHCSIPIVNSPKLFFPHHQLFVLGTSAIYNACSTLISLSCCPVSPILAKHDVFLV
jgi:hypothetical protein